MSISSRLQKLQTALASKNIEALLISTPQNIYYLTGFPCPHPEERESLVLITPTEVFLITHVGNQGLELPHLALEITAPQESFYQRVISLLQKKNIKKLAFEKQNLRFYEHHYLQTTASDIVLDPAFNLTEALRHFKDTLEIALLKEVGQKTARIFSQVGAFFQTKNF